MRVRSKWSLVLASCFVLSLSAAACGDDADDNTSEPTAGKGGSSSGGAGGSTGGKGGSSATGGKGGSTSGGAGGSTGGKGGSSANGGTGGSGTVTVADCKSKVDDIAGDELPGGCSMCICEDNVKAGAACDEACWSVIKCAAEKCGDVPAAMKQACAGNMCSSEISAASSSGSIGAVTAVSMSLQGQKCGATCNPPDGDAGTP